MCVGEATPPPVASPWKRLEKSLSQITRKVKLILSGANRSVFITLIYYTLVTFVLCHINSILKEGLWLTEGQQTARCSAFPEGVASPTAALRPPSPSQATAATGAGSSYGRREAG